MIETILALLALIAAVRLLRRRLPRPKPTPAELWEIHHRPHWD